MKDCFKGHKIRLRAVEMSDLEDYYLKTDGDTDALESSDRLIFPVSKETRRKRIESLSHQNPYDETYTLIIENEEGVPVGNINTHSINRIDGVFMYGLGILKSYRRKGYGREAIELLCRFYFETLNFRKVEVHIYGFNQSSITLHEKMGFIKEGVLRQNHYANNQYHDTYCYGLLKEEFHEIFRKK
ncbi:MAG: GNAT family N-acetyltransferase [Clostridia bacterium]|nr:GNAT family N-acetyltransferase [Clostridia bacterium]